MPYDPIKKEIILIQQFRAGILSRYDEDYLYRSSLLSSDHIIPIIIYSLIISFFYVYIFANDEISTFLIDFEFSLFVVWIILFFLYLFYIPLRILIIKSFFLFINEVEKFKIIFLINFIRITIFFSLINIFVSYLSIDFWGYQVQIQSHKTSYLLLIS